MPKVQFEFSERALGRLDEIKEIADATTRAEVVRRALSIYGFLLEKSAAGYTIHLVQDDVVEPVPPQLLHNV